MVCFCWVGFNVYCDNSYCICSCKNDETNLRPYLQFNLTYTESSVIVNLENVGVGPAIVTGFKVIAYDDQDQEIEITDKANQNEPITNLYDSDGL